MAKKSIDGKSFTFEAKHIMLKNAMKLVFGPTVSARSMIKRGMARGTWLPVNAIG